MAETGICIVAPQGEACTPAQLTWIAGVRGLAADLGQKVRIFRTVLRTSRRKDESGRRFLVLDPWNAKDLYTLIHRGHYAVFQAGQARVLLDPLKELSSANSIALVRLVRYKAYFAQFDGSTPPSDLFREFDTWTKTAHIDSHRDCRVLPLHMFAPSRDWPGLTPPSGREEFERVHGKPAQLADEDSRAWKQPNGMHGHDSLLVANYALPTGFHWDVNAARTESRLASLHERWRFPPGAYANVSPDGHIRGGQSSGVSARREGIAPRPPEPEPTRAAKKTARRRRSDGRRR